MPSSGTTYRPYTIRIWKKNFKLDAVVCGWYSAHCERVHTHDWFGDTCRVKNKIKDVELNLIDLFTEVAIEIVSEDQIDPQIIVD